MRNIDSDSSDGEDIFAAVAKAQIAKLGKPRSEDSNEGDEDGTILEAERTNNTTSNNSSVKSKQPPPVSVNKAATKKRLRAEAEEQSRGIRAGISNKEAGAGKSKV